MNQIMTANTCVQSYFILARSMCLGGAARAPPRKDVDFTRGTKWVAITYSTVWANSDPHIQSQSASYKHEDCSNLSLLKHVSVKGPTGVQVSMLSTESSNSDSYVMVKAFGTE